MEFSMRKLGVIFFCLLTAPMAAIAADEFLYWGVMAGQAKVKGQDPLGANFNYDPTNSDEKISEMVKIGISYKNKLNPDSNMEIIPAYEGLVIEI